MSGFIVCRAGLRRPLAEFSRKLAALYRMLVAATRSPYHRGPRLGQIDEEVIWHPISNDLALRIMRTTIDIDDAILREVRAIHEREGRAMGAIVSELLADALTRRRSTQTSFRWTARPMSALADLADKEAVYAALDAERS
jgi:hypothetical protein